MRTGRGPALLQHRWRSEPQWWVRSEAFVETMQLWIGVEERACGHVLAGSRCLVHSVQTGLLRPTRDRKADALLSVWKQEISLQAHHSRIVRPR